MPERAARAQVDRRGSRDAEPQSAIQVDGRVVEELPSALFRVELQTEGRPRVTAHVSSASGLLRVLTGDLVVVELAPYDGSRGRIVKRLAKR